MTNHRTVKSEGQRTPQVRSQVRRDLPASPRAVKSKGRRISAIEIISFLAFVYVILGYLNETYLHLVDSFWLSNYSDRIAIVAFGNFIVARQKNSYTRMRLAVLTFLIATLWILIPYFTGSTFFNHHVIGSIWFFAYLIIVFCFGRRADCSWNCPCVGLRDTAGDAFRGKTLKGDWYWKLRHLKWPFLVSLLVYLFLFLAFPRSLVTKKYIFLFWAITNGLYFASFLVIPWTGSRNFCRICPWGALYGLIGKLGFFKIVADREKCVPCRICEASCDMGIPIKLLVQEHGEINVPDCVGCGRCVTECPRGALRIVDIRDYLTEAWDVWTKRSSRQRLS